MSSLVVTGLVALSFAERKGYDNSRRDDEAFLFSESDILRPALYSFCPNQIR